MSSNQQRNTNRNDPVDKNATIKKQTKYDQWKMGGDEDLAKIKRERMQRQWQTYQQKSPLQNQLSPEASPQKQSQSQPKLQIGTQQRLQQQKQQFQQLAQQQPHAQLQPQYSPSNFFSPESRANNSNFQNAVRTSTMMNEPQSANEQKTLKKQSMNAPLQENLLLIYNQIKSDKVKIMSEDDEYRICVLNEMMNEFQYDSQCQKSPNSWAQQNQQDNRQRMSNYIQQEQQKPKQQQYQQVHQTQEKQSSQGQFSGRSMLLPVTNVSNRRVNLIRKLLAKAADLKDSYRFSYITRQEYIKSRKEIFAQITFLEQNQTQSEQQSQAKQQSQMSNGIIQEANVDGSHKQEMQQQQKTTKDVQTTNQKKIQSQIEQINSSINNNLHNYYIQSENHQQIQEIDMGGLSVAEQRAQQIYQQFKDNRINENCENDESDFHCGNNQKNENLFKKKKNANLFNKIEQAPSSQSQSSSSSQGSSSQSYVQIEVIPEQENESGSSKKVDTIVEKFDTLEEGAKNKSQQSQLYTDIDSNTETEHNNSSSTNHSSRNSFIEYVSNSIPRRHDYLSAHYVNNSAPNKQLVKQKSTYNRFLNQYMQSYADQTQQCYDHQDHQKKQQQRLNHHQQQEYQSQTQQLQTHEQQQQRSFINNDNESTNNFTVCEQFVERIQNIDSRGGSWSISNKNNHNHKVSNDRHIHNFRINTNNSNDKINHQNDSMYRVNQLHNNSISIGLQHQQKQNEKSKSNKTHLEQSKKSRFQQQKTTLTNNLSSDSSSSKKNNELQSQRSSISSGSRQPQLIRRSAMLMPYDNVQENLIEDEEAYCQGFIGGLIEILQKQKQHGQQQQSPQLRQFSRNYHQNYLQSQNSSKQKSQKGQLSNTNKSAFKRASQKKNPRQKVSIQECFHKVSQNQIEKIQLMRKQQEKKQLMRKQNQKQSMKKQKEPMKTQKKSITLQKKSAIVSKQQPRSKPTSCKNSKTTLTQKQCKKGSSQMKLDQLKQHFSFDNQMVLKNANLEDSYKEMSADQAKKLLPQQYADNIALISLNSNLAPLIQNEKKVKSQQQPKLDKKDISKRKNHQNHQELKEPKQKQ